MSDNGYIDNRSQIQVHTDERTQVHSAQSSLVVTHPSINRSRRALTSMNGPLSYIALVEDQVETAAVSAWASMPSSQKSARVSQQFAVNLY